MAVTVHVVAGFLGTGKTSVLRALLSDVGDEAVGVLVNDFGEAAIDQAVLADASTSVREIRGSCVCCTAPEGFVAEVKSLLGAGSPDRIFVEPTGIARPADVIDTLRRAPFADRISIGPLIVVVDAHQVGSGQAPAHVVEQAAAADVLVVNRIDTASKTELEAVRSWSASLWPGPHAVVETSYGAVDRSVLAWPDPASRRKPRGPTQVTPADHPYSVRTLSWAPDVVFHRTRLIAALESPQLVRAKGVFRTEEGTVLLQAAAGRVQEEPSPRRSDTRVDLIVEHGATGALEASSEALVAAILSGSELQALASRLEIALPDGRRRVFDRTALIGLPDPIGDVSVVVPGRAGAGARVWRALEAAGATRGAQAVVVAADGFVTEPVPLAVLREGILLHSVDGAPLPDDKGGPFRLLLPPGAADGVGGPCANVKSVVRIAIRDAS